MPLFIGVRANGERSSVFAANDERLCRRGRFPRRSQKFDARGRRVVGTAQKVVEPVDLVCFVDHRSSATQCIQRTKNAAVGLVRPRHRALPAPARFAQRIEATMVRDPSGGIPLEGMRRMKNVLGVDSPSQSR